MCDAITDRIATIHRALFHCGELRLRVAGDGHEWVDTYAVITTSLSFFGSATDLYDDGCDPMDEIVLANILVVESSSERDADSVFDVHARVKTGGNADGVKMFTLDAGDEANARRWMEQLCQAVGVLELLPAEGGGYVSIISETAVARRAEQRRLSAMKLLAFSSSSSSLTANDGWSSLLPITTRTILSQEEAPWPGSSTSSSSSCSSSGKGYAGRRPSFRSVPFAPGRGGGRGRGPTFIGAEPGASHMQPPAVTYSAKLNASDSPLSSSPDVPSANGSCHRPKKRDDDRDENGEEKANHVFSVPDPCDRQAVLHEEVHYDESRSAARAMKMLSLRQAARPLLAGRGGGRGRGLMSAAPTPPPPLISKALAHVPI